MEKTRQAEEEQDEVATEPGAAAEPVQAMMAEAALPGQPAASTAEDPMPAKEAPSPTVTPNAGGNPAVDSVYCVGDYAALQLQRCPCTPC
jgi:hypothetical protein